MKADRLEELAKALLEARLPADCPERLGFRVKGCTHDDAVRKTRDELGVEGCPDLDFTRQEDYSCSRSPGLWEHLRDEVRELCRDDARAACEYFFGRDKQGKVVVPEQGAVKTAVEALGRVCTRLQTTGPIGTLEGEIPRVAQDVRQALRALRGGDDG